MEIYGNVVNILCVYIMEAHATDQWPLGRFSKRPQHKTLQDRIDAAINLKQKPISNQLWLLMI